MKILRGMHSLQKRKKCATALVHRIASRTWAFRHQGHGGQSASKSCSSNSAGGRQTHALHRPAQESARMLSRPETSGKGHGTWSGPADGQFLLETSLEGGACQKHIVSGCLFEGGCDSDLANCTSSGTSWKCASIGSKTNASGIVVQVLTDVQRQS